MPIPDTVGAFAIVPSNDLKAAIPFWERMGFARTGGDSNYIIMTGWDCEVHLAQAGSGLWRVPENNNPFGVFIRTPNVDAIASSSFLYSLALQQPWYELTFGGILAIENQIPAAYITAVDGFKTHYGDILQPDDYAFHTIHITVDEDHGGHVGEFAERYLDTEPKRRASRAAYFAGAELTRRCWDNLSECSW